MSLYYIQNRMPCGNCVSWWRAGGAGYTCEIDQAGQFTEEQAVAIVRDRPDIDKAWKCEDVIGVVKQHVDFQSLRNFKPLAVEIRKARCPLYGYPTREDAMERAEQSSCIVNEEKCLLCGLWHLRESRFESEANEAAARYRRELSEKFPSVAAQRGWL